MPASPHRRHGPERWPLKIAPPPSATVQVDQSHPLAGGCVAWWQAGNGLYDALGGNGHAVQVSPGALQQSASGIGFGSASASARYAYVPNAPRWKPTGAITVACYATALGSGGGTNDRLFGSEVNGLTGGFGLYNFSATTAQLFIAINGSWTDIGVGRTIVNGSPNLYCLSYDGSTVTAAIDSTVGTSAASGAITHSTATLDFGCQGNNTSGGGAPAQALIHSLAIWNRALSAGERAWLVAEPFAPLRPVARKLYLPLVSSGVFALSLSESAASSDSLTAAMTVAASLSETAASSDARTAAMTVAASLSETAASSDSDASAMTVAAALSETAASSDAPSAAMTVAAALADSAATSESLAGLAIILGSTSDSTTTSDSWSGSVVGSGVYSASLSESTAASDSYAASVAMAVSLAESLATSDAWVAAMTVAASLAESAATAGYPALAARRPGDFFFGMP